MRTRLKSALVAVTASFVVVPAVAMVGAAATHAGYAAFDCRGMAATIVGSPNSDTPLGTEGNDVIVTNGGTAVIALGGNDTICVTNGGLPYVSGGDGDDVVDASASPAFPGVHLDNGSDTYFGNKGVDKVWADGPEGSDTIYTGGGPDHVSSGVRSEPMNNTIDLGSGNDVIELKGTLTGTIRGGSGRDQLRLSEVAAPEGDWRFDNAQGLATHEPGDVVARFDGMESFALAELRNSALVFVGSPRAESLTMSTGRFGAGADASGSLRARMGGGTDKLAVDGGLRLDIAGGSGRDKLTFRASPSTVQANTALTMDLRTRTVVGAGTTVRYTSFQDAALKAPSRSTLIGTSAPNSLTMVTCLGRIDALGGNDRLTAAAYGQDCFFPGAPRPRVQMFGRGGDDRMIGGYGHDRLIGGRGFDHAFGSEGKDVCAAEREARCELNPN